MNDWRKFEKSQLIAYLQEICAIIYFQSSLKEQDAWLKSRIEENGYKKVGEEE